MATYKVIQDIEAEDKLVGPLTLRQFIYAGIAAVCLYICFLAFTKGASFLIAFFLPPAAVAGFFAFPWRGEQPTEIWALARIRFAIKPRVRIWDQEGAKDLVTVLAPKKLRDSRPVRHLSQSEVRSRLKALAETIDSRGWATRNAAYGMNNPSWSQQNMSIVAPNPGMAAFIPDEDMFDGKNTVAQTFDAMLAKSQEAQRQRVMQSMAQAQQGGSVPRMPQQPSNMPNIPTPAMSSAYAIAPAPAPTPVPAAGHQQPQQNNYWFTNGPAYPTNPAQQTRPAMPLGSSAPSIQPQPAQQQPSPSLPIMPAPILPAHDQASPGLSAPSLPLPPMPGPTGGFGQTRRPRDDHNHDHDDTASQAPAGIDPRIESDMPLAVSATPTEAEDEMARDLKQQNDNAVTISYGHMRVLQPVGAQQPATPTSIDPYARPSDQPEEQYINGAGNPVPAVGPMTQEPNPAILELANNDDLDIATLARQANKEINKAPDEVEIRLR